MPCLVHCDSFQEQCLPLRRQPGQFGEERIEIGYRSIRAAQFKWDQLSCVQAGIIATVIIQDSHISSAYGIRIVGLLRFRAYQHPYALSITGEIVLLSQREIDFNVLCHVLFVHGHFSSYSFLWFYPNNSCSALIARSTPAANSSSVLPWNARFLRTSSWYAGFISSGQWPAPEI